MTSTWCGAPYLVFFWAPRYNTRVHSIVKHLVWVDQLSKLCATMLLKGTVTLVPGLLELVLVRNKGVSFGFLASLDRVQMARLKLAIMLVTLLLYLYYRFQRFYMSRLRLSAVELLIAGAASNLLDRFVYGGVIDFLSISLFGNHMFTCNFADVYLTLGVILFLLSTAERTPRRPEGFKDILFKEDGL